MDLFVSRQRVLLTWFLTSLLIFALMVIHKSDVGQIFGRYSSSYAFSMLIVFACTIVALAGYYLDRAGRLPILLGSLPHRRWFAFTVIFINIIILMLFWRFFGSWNVLFPAIFRFYIASLFMGLTLLLLFRSVTAQLLLSNRWFWGVLLLLIVGMLLLTALYLGKVPPSRFYDEAWEVNWAWTSYIAPRSFQLPMFPYFPVDRIALRSAIIPIAGQWMGLFGAGLNPLRLFYLVVGGWGSLPFIYLTARHVYGSNAALVSIAIAAFIPLMNNYDRPDIFVCLLVCIGLYFFFTARSSNGLWRHFLVGLAVVFTMEGSPYAICFVLAFGLVYFFDYLHLVWKTRRWHWNPGFWTFVLGGSLYIPFYIVVHALSAPNGIANLALPFKVYDQTTQINPHGVIDRIVSVNIQQYIDYFSSYSLEALLGVLSIVFAVVRRGKNDKYLLAIWFLALLFFVYLKTYPTPYYYTFNLPFIALLGGAMVAQIGRSLNMAKLNFAVLAGISAIAVLFSVQTVLMAENGRGQSAEDFIDIGHEVDQIVPQNLSIIGWESYYLGMPYRLNFLSTLTFLHGKPETWGVALPQAVIVTSGLDDMHSEIDEYITTTHLSKAYCFQMSVFGHGATLYLPETLLPKDAPVNCGAG